MIRVVILDFDGTLVDSNQLKRNCMERVVSGLQGGAAALAAARAEGGDRYRIFASVARVLDRSGEPDMIRDHARTLIDAYTECCRRGIVAAPERRGARAALVALKRRGYRVWINSATPERNLPELLRGRGLLPYLDGAVGGPRSKAANIRKILAAERCPPRQAVMVGDGPDDLTGARQARTWFVAITAENRIPGRGAFAMRDLAALVPLIARHAVRPRRMP